LLTAPILLNPKQANELFFQFKRLAQKSCGQGLYMTRDKPETPIGIWGECNTPQSLEAERGFLSAIIVDNIDYAMVSGFLQPEHFAHAPHRRIYKAMTELIDGNQSANPKTLRRYFVTNEGLADIGDFACLAELNQPVTILNNAVEYARIIHDLYLKRELIALCEDTAFRAYGCDKNVSAKELFETVEQNIYDIATSSIYSDHFQGLKEAIYQFIETAEVAHLCKSEVTGISTGFQEIDCLIGGFHPSDLIILVGNSAQGSRGFTTNIAYNAAKTYHYERGNEGAVVGYFSPHDSVNNIVGRLIAQQSNLSLEKIHKGEVTDEQFTHLISASQELHHYPVFIDDTQGLTISAIRTRARMLKRRHGLGLLIVDQMRLIGSPGQEQNVYQSMQTIIKNLKNLAHELHIPILVLASTSLLSSDHELSHKLDAIGDTSDLFNMADVLIRLAFEKQPDTADGLIRTEVNIDKNRHGKIGSIFLQFDQHQDLFVEKEV
jgi:replicative DNA helicase